MSIKRSLTVIAAVVAIMVFYSIWSGRVDRKENFQQQEIDEVLDARPDADTVESRTGLSGESVGPRDRSKR